MTGLSQRESTMAGVSVVVPTLNAAQHITPLLEALFSQQPEGPKEVILVDSMSEDETTRLAESFPHVKIVAIEKFSHGAARNLGVREASGEYVAFLSQDALPADSSWLYNLLLPFQDHEVAAAYSRQIPYDHANPMEKFFLSTRFPPGDLNLRALHGTDEPAFAEVFFSNVSSAARRNLLLRYPFDENLIMSEDQKFSFDLLQAGYKVAYQPKSVVMHSHDYTLKLVFQRYFDSVYSITEIFREHGLSTTFSMGAVYTLREFSHIMTKHPLWLPYYALYMSAKTAGTLSGHVADRIPLSLKKRMSLHSYHWD